VVAVPAPLRGQVWEYTSGSRQYRVLIISSDEYNDTERAFPWALGIEREAPAVPGYLIRLSAADPLTGAAVDVTRVVRVDTTALRRVLGYVSTETLNAVERGLREFLSLP